MLPACWLQFLRAIETFSDLYRSGFHPPHGDLAYPPTIEGMPLSLIKHSLYLPDGLFSVHTFLFRAHLEPFPALPPLLALAAIFAVWLWRSRRSPVESLLPGMAAWIFLADLFLPILRESYDDVLILNVVAAGLAIASRPPWATWPCLLALPIGGAVYLLNLDHPWVVMPSALFTFGAILALYPSESRAITIAPATRASSPASGTPGTPPRAAASG